MTDQPQDESDENGSGRDVPALLFPRQDSQDIAIHECRIYCPDGRLKQIIRERTVGEVAAQPLPPFLWGKNDFELKEKSF